MQPQNVDEYRMCRAELDSLKGCMTAYIGFVLGGAAAAFVALGSLEKDKINAPFLGLMCLALSLTVSFVFLVLVYKFASHNRFAGYCKLLTQERFTGDAGPLILWEICMDWLRASDVDPAFLLARCPPHAIPATPDQGKQHLAADHLSQRVAFCYSKDGADWGAKRRGAWHLLQFLFWGRSLDASWRYPLYVASTFASLVLIFGMIGWVLVLQADDMTGIASSWRHGLLWVATALQLLLWLRFLGKLHSLMLGSNTVDANCWKFLPIRYELVRQALGESCGYRLIGVKEATLKAAPVRGPWLRIGGVTGRLRVS